MPSTTSDHVPSTAPQDAGGAGAISGLSGRWGQQHSAPLPEGLSGLGARGQEPVSPGPDRFGVTTRRLIGDMWEPIHKSAARKGDRVRHFTPDGSLLAEFRATSDAYIQTAGALTGEWVYDGVFVPQEPEPVAPGPTLADVVAERDYERRRANEAIAQLHDAQRELAALRGHAPDAGKKVNG